MDLVNISYRICCPALGGYKFEGKKSGGKKSGVCRTRRVNHKN